MASKWKAGDLLAYQGDISNREAIYLIVSIGECENTAPILMCTYDSNADRQRYWRGRLQEDQWHETNERVTLIGNIFERNT